jgi:hypothetical protein
MARWGCRRRRPHVWLLASLSLCSLRVAEFGGVGGWVGAVFSYLRWRQTDKQHKCEKKQEKKKEK